MASLIEMFLPQRQLARVTSPSDGRGLGYFMRQTASKVVVTEDTALTYSAVWAATRLLSGTAGWLPLNLYRRLPAGGQEVARENPKHALMHDRPNTESVAMLVKSSMVAQQVNCGNAYAEIERSFGGQPLNLWPIHASRVTRKRNQDGEVIYEVRNNNDKPSYIPAADMLHIPSMMSDNGVDGIGVIRNARECIGMGLATERTGAAHFGNGGIPLIVITHPGEMSEPARANFRREWQEIHGGAENSGKMALLAEGAKLEKLNLSMEDQQFLTTRQHNIEEIARWYGVPPHMIQHLLRSTYSNIEAQGIDFVVYSLIPWLSIWEQCLNSKLLTDSERENHFFKFNVNALLRGDAAARANFYSTMVTNGLMRPNEVRELEDLNPYEEGDELYMQGAMVPVSMIGKTPQNTGSAVPKEEPPPEEPDEPDETEPDEEPEDEGLSAILLQLRAMEARLNELSPPKAEKPEDVFRKAARSMLSGAIGRMIHKEATAARRAANKPGEFLSWLDAFYDARHTANCTDAIAAPCEALATLGVTVPDVLWCDTHKAELLELSGTCSATDLPAAVDAHMSVWEQSRVNELVESICPLKG